MTDTDRPPRPDPVAVEPDAVPETLTEREQWIAWRYKFDTGRDEWTKVPVDADTGGFAKSTDSDTWTSFSEALDYHGRAGTDTDGLGFVFSESGTVAGVDLDDCRDPDTGDLEPWADELLADVATYTEISPSGTGLHLYGLGFIPDGGNRADVSDGAGHLEMYDSGRFFTVTGARVDGTPDAVEQVNDEIADVHAAHIADDEPDPKTPKPAGDGGVRADSPGANPGEDAEPSPRDAPDGVEVVEENGDVIARRRGITDHLRGTRRRVWGRSPSVAARSPRCGCAGPHPRSAARPRRRRTAGGSGRRS